MKLNISSIDEAAREIFDGNFNLRCKAKQFVYALVKLFLGEEVKSRKLCQNHLSRQRIEIESIVSDVLGIRNGQQV